MFTGFMASARGESHKEKGQPCQDAVGFKRYRNGGIAVVADGHGSEKHFRSDTGARIAVQIAQETIVEFSKILTEKQKELMKANRLSSAKDNFDEYLKQLERSIIMRWRQETLNHFSANPLTDGEKAICDEYAIDIENDNNKVRSYGTTLIAAILHTDWWFVIQIGDGKCVMLDGEGEPVFAVPEDEAMGFGKTTSLCDSNAAENFRHVYGFNKIKGLTVATDGVSDSFIPEAYLEFHEQLYADFARNQKMARDGVTKGVAAWSANGSRDDASMAGVFYFDDTMFEKIKGLSTPKV
jgi:serine/threonine protein phosphatase PrpC